MIEEMKKIDVTMTPDPSMEDESLEDLDRGADAVRIVIATAKKLEMKLTPLPTVDADS